MSRVAGVLVSLGLVAAWSTVASLQTPTAVRVSSAGAALTGTLTAVWGDPSAGSTASPSLLITLTEDNGTEHTLTFEPGVLEAAGGLRAVDRREVTIVTRDAVQAQSTAPLVVTNIARKFDAPAALADEMPLTGSQPWVTIPCRFADVATTPHPISYFQGILGSTAPGMDHYWREVSYDNINLTGTQVTSGWYTLPQPRSYYVTSAGANLNLLKTDCTAAADAEVFFPTFVGINLVFNDVLDCCAWGGSSSVNLDGQNKSYRMTWLPPWAQVSGVFAHEMGHGFGFPHSSGPYSATYDSNWDPMSNAHNNKVSNPTYGPTPVHTITFHKDLDLWIPSARKFTPTSGSASISLERLSQPTSAGTYLMAKIPIAGSSTNFYTVEARKMIGYDAGIPGDAVIIHKVLTTLGDRDAQVVDATNDNNPNDAGAMWLPGETFNDAANGITIAVNSTFATGFNVTITVGSLSPQMALEAPTAGSTKPQPFTVAGWAIDPAAPSGTGVDTVHVWAFPTAGGSGIFAGAATYGTPRSDVSAAYGSRFLNSGYSLVVRGLPPGSYTLQAHAHSTATGTFNQNRSAANVNVQAQPLVALDNPGNSTQVTPPFNVGGWAIDLAAGTGTGVDTVHVYAFPNPGSGTPPVFLGAATYGTTRSDVGSAYGAQFAPSGYGLVVPSLPPGLYQISVYAHSTMTNAFSAVSSVQVTVALGQAMMIDGPADGSTVGQPFDLGGWAVDGNAATGTGVDMIHVYATPQIPGGSQRFLGAAAYGISRPDVGSAYGSRFTDSGYQMRIGGLPQGWYQISVYARSTSTGAFSNVQTVTVLVRRGGVIFY